MAWREQSDNRQVLYDSNDNLVLEVGDDSSLYNKAGTLLLNGIGGSQPVAPEDYGAVGDGVTNDTAALQAMFATGRDMRLKDGKTYLHRQRLIMNAAGTIFNGAGATLKRAAQVVTTTATSITSGVTSSITLASAAGLVVGDQIVIEQGGTYDASARTIATIVGNVVTVTGTFGQTFSGTTNVRTGWNQILVAASDCRITDLILDGNSSNWTWGRWDHTVAINGNGLAPRLFVDHSRIINQYGDAFSPAAAGWSFAFNDVEQVKGRGVVFAANTNQTSDLGTRVVYNRFINCNGDTAVGASDGTGTINFSQGGPATLIHGNYIEGGVHGIGALRTTNSSHATITDNEFWNLTGRGIDGNSGGNSQMPSDVVIANNRFYGCPISVDNTSFTAVAKRWRIVNNTVVGSQIIIRNIDDVIVQNNTVSGAAIGAPTAAFATAVVGGGTFAANTYYYRVTATNAAGESVGTTEVSAVVALNGSVSLNWYIVPGATGYKIYRTTSSGTYTPTALLATITSPMTYTYTDTGAALTSGALPATDTTMLTTLALITLGGSGAAVTNAVVSGNRLTGGQYAVRIDASVAGLSFQNNYCTGQFTLGIFCASSTGVSSIDILNNVVIATAANDTVYSCISTFGSPVVRGNRFDFTAAVSTSNGACEISGSSSDVIFESNKIIGGSHSQVLNIRAGAARTVVRNNQMDFKLSDSGTNTQRAGNKFSTANFEGRAVLVAGTVTVSTAEVLTGDNIILTVVLAGGTQGFLSVSTIVNATSFIILSSNASDTSTVYWKIDH